MEEDRAANSQVCQLGTAYRPLIMDMTVGLRGRFRLQGRLVLWPGVELHSQPNHEGPQIPMNAKVSSA